MTADQAFDKAIRMAKIVTTMEDFAALAGLSRPTVSKYFNDPGSVRASTRQKIEQALRKYNYRPNLHASNLNRRNGRILGILVPNLGDPFYAALIREIERLALEHGYFTIALSSHGLPERELQAIENIRSMNVLGLIAAPLGFVSDLAAFDHLRAQIPLVLLDARIELDEVFVGTNNAMGIELVVDYLLRTDSAPVYFDMPHVNSNSIERLNAYRQAMLQAGLEPRVLADGTGNLGWDFEQYAFRHASELIKSNRLNASARTILCANDRIAFGLLAAAFRAGLRVGRWPHCDLRVAGHDNQPLSEFTCPSLTTAAQDIPALAEAALNAILTLAGLKSGPSPGDRILDARLVLRESA